MNVVEGGVRFGGNVVVMREGVFLEFLVGVRFGVMDVVKFVFGVIVLVWLFEIVSW